MAAPEKDHGKGLRHEELDHLVVADRPRTMGGLIRHGTGVRVPVHVRDLGPEVGREDAGLLP
eukprot:14481586-Alexandrium_andersonii.AAC.1